MRLIDLNPRFLGSGGEGITDSLTGLPSPERHGVGVLFDCPCGCGRDCFVPFANPLDGGPSVHGNGNSWARTGETFEALTLTPSILRSPERGGCGWHGFITNGAVLTV